MTTFMLKRDANPIQQIEDVSFIIDSNLKIFSLLPSISDYFRGKAESIIVMQLHEHLHQDQ